MSDPLFEMIGDRVDHLTEEAAELALECNLLVKDLMKAKRFGLDNRNPSNGESNRHAILARGLKIRSEFNDFVKRLAEVERELMGGG